MKSNVIDCILNNNDAFHQKDYFHNKQFQNQINKNTK